jgi:transcriptional regulator with XRE-family HTH domain
MNRRAVPPDELRQALTSLRQARAALQWTVRDLAEKADVHFNTVWRLENGLTLSKSSLTKIVGAFEAHGVEFLADGGVRLKDQIG